MQESTEIGRNRTGMQTSPVHSKELMEIVDTGIVDSGIAEAGIIDAGIGKESIESRTLTDVRIEYIQDADVVGSIPPPGSLKGMVKSGAKMLTGNRPQVFIDKLAERLAFERGGTRLYDALIAKYMAHAGADGANAHLTELQQFRSEEAAHANLVSDCIEQLGADPTAQTPSADLVGVEAMGLLQAITDPRTTLTDCLHVALSAELLDNAGWELLIELAKSMGHDQMAAGFESALQEENRHLSRVREWHSSLVMKHGEIFS